MQKVEITRIANGHGILRIRFPARNSLATQIASIPSPRSMTISADVETTVCISASFQAKGTA